MLGAAGCMPSGGARAGLCCDRTYCEIDLAALGDLLGQDMEEFEHGRYALM